jgi:hypothetical protein
VEFLVQDIHVNMLKAGKLQPNVYCSASHYCTAQRYICRTKDNCIAYCGDNCVFQLATGFQIEHIYYPSDAPAALYPQDDFLVLIFVKGSVNLRAIMWLERLRKLKK